ncbi:MAG: hypothetical protein HC879_12135 [Leptolyngbyaceae cyanobacterium SL_5_9]|nr:hypothetical protein [Leptolyngbyaceae cyanobacterium SM1_4_3]NJN58181.1 hypothetical protein [Leptolyngbyaceae cyanobacterium SL_5_9]NJO72875.1 hypothetical protein [Leptolyngbyaceae cyanobacterium RM1_406_9]
MKTPSKRKRGVIISGQGWQRLQQAKRKMEMQGNAGELYTLEELSKITHLSSNTITKVQRRKFPVDKQTLESFFKSFNLTLIDSDYAETIDSLPLVNRERIVLGGQIPLDSLLYVERPPVESLCYEAIVQPGALIRIKAPKQMGKTSLMARVLQQAREQNIRTVTLSFQLADTQVFLELDRLLRWLCAIASSQLGLPKRISEYWDDIFGSNYNATHYFENYLLKEIDSDLVLALDEVDEVFHYPEITADFLGLLRAWYEKSRYGDGGSVLWQKLRIIIVHSTEVCISLPVNQSPFNVGLSVELPEFTPKQVQDLSERHGLRWKAGEIEQLMALVGGNPYLIQLALYHLSNEEVTLDELIKTAIAEDGIYGSHLQQQLWRLKRYPELLADLQRVVLSPSPLEVEPIQALKLQNLGVVRVQNQRVSPRCELYARYFKLALAIT